MGMVNFLGVWSTAMAIVFPYFASGNSTKDTFFSLDLFLELYAPVQRNTSQCYADVLNFKSHAKKFTPWALWMLDASSKIPSSFLVGNEYDLGNFDECLAVRDNETTGSSKIVGKYCLVHVTFKQSQLQSLEDIKVRDLTNNRHLAVCMPATCDAGHLSELLNFALKDIASKIRVENCQSSLDDSSLPLSSWIVILFVLLLLVLVTTATWIEYRSIQLSRWPIQSVVLSFSLIANGKMLLNTVSSTGGTIENISGIRVISMLAILASHENTEPHRAMVNLTEALDKTKDNLLESILRNGGAMSVNTFFLLGGIVLARKFMAERRAQVSFSYFRYVLHHFFRFTPAYAFMMIIYITIFYHFTVGPDQEVLRSQRDGCIKNWWRHFLYVNNINHRKCLAYTWYLGADMQLYITAPLFLFILHKSCKLGIVCIVITTIISCINIFQTSYINSYYGYPVSFGQHNNDEWFAHIYTRFETRISGYLVGLLLGYFLEHLKKHNMKIGSVCMKIPTFQL